MNIYYVNRYSKLKGPFDIIDSNRQHIIKVGDICLRDTIGGVAFYVVYNSSNTWNSCKMVGLGENDTLPEIGNALLFSFDGLSRRKGDIALIKKIRMCFREKVIDDFFFNAVDILEYRKDFWEGSLFPQFFASSQELVDRDEQRKSDVSTDTNHYPSIFAKYLNKELLEQLINSLNEGNELKEAYQNLRKEHPELFRKALMKFLTENPGGTIFDKPADAYVPTEIVKEVEVPKASSHGLRPLVRPLVISENIEDEPFKTNERINKIIIGLNRQPFISIEEEIELAQKIRRGDGINARNKLVSANLRFVVGIAKEYLHKGLEFEDLLHEGFLGLIKAAERFDETRGFKFIDYAVWWIKRYLTDAIVRNSSLIHFPLSVRILHRRIWDFKVIYEHQNGYFPPVTDIEIAGEDDLDRISFLNSLPNNLSNACIPCEDYDVFEEYHNDILDYEDNEYKKYYVRSLLARLSKRERDILIRVFGIGVREETLEMIGESRGLTRERVRQIREKAIKKLREMVIVTSAEGQLSKSQSTQNENGSSHAITTKTTEETQTLREVKKAFSQARFNIVQLTEAKRRKLAENDKVKLPSEKTNETLRKVVDLNTRNYSVVNYNGKCNIYDHNRRLVYSSTGSVIEINQSYYRVSLTHTFFSIGLIKRNIKGDLFNADKILLANQQTKLHHKLKRKDFIEMIEDIKRDGRRRLKVDECWYDERGNVVFENTNSDSNIIELKKVEKESIEENNTPIKREIPNVIDEFGVEQVFVDTPNAFPYREVEVEEEQVTAVIKEYAPVKEEYSFHEPITNADSFTGQKEEKTQASLQEAKKKKQKNQLTIQGTKYDIDLDIWGSIEWRKVLNDITERAYWNYHGPLEIYLSEYVAPSIEQRERIIGVLCHLLSEGYHMNVDKKTCVVKVAQKFDYDKDGQVVTLPSGSFDENLSQFRSFVIKNKHYPFMDGEHDEIALRKWFREVGHGLVAMTDAQKILFDDLGVEFANMPKTRSQLEKMAETIVIPADVDDEEETIEEPDIDPELERFLNTPIRYLPLSDKTSKFLIDLGYDIFEEIPQIESFQALASARKGGLEAAKEIEQYLNNYNLTFGMSYEEVVELIVMPDEVIINELFTSKREKKLTKTIQDTLDLAKQGYTFEAIASKRELSLYTISQHLSILILRGFVDVFDFVDHYTYTLISNVIQELPKGATSKRIKSKCPEGIKRNTIRMVMADMKRKQNDKE